MSEYVTLIGAEEVSKASYTMRDAASSIVSAAESLGSSLRQHSQDMENLLWRLERILQEANVSSPE